MRKGRPRAAAALMASLSTLCVYVRLCALYTCAARCVCHFPGGAVAFAARSSVSPPLAALSLMGNRFFTGQRVQCAT